MGVDNREIRGKPELVGGVEGTGLSGSSLGV